MKKLIKKMGDMMVAITFAEAGELDTAKELMRDAESPDSGEREMDPSYDAA